MIPSGADNITLREVETVEFASNTYKFSFNEKRINGMTDGLSAVIQALYKILSTERYDFAIYSGNYGVELTDLYGKDENFVKSELPRRITEALMADNRVENVDNFHMEVSPERADTLLVTFNVSTVEGFDEMQVEVLSI